MRSLGKPALICLLTDFGYQDPYVGVVKGVILGINPQAVIVDLCHGLEAQDVAGAAYILGAAYPYFPQGTIHLAVVDPEVGSQRACLLVETERASFVAPDNGLLSWVVAEAGWDSAGKPGRANRALVVRLTNQHYWLAQVSTTFQGRDIMAPVAAHLSLGVLPGEMGEPVEQVRMLPLLGGEKLPDGTLVGHVAYIDHFGNLITDLRAEEVRALGEKVTIQVGGQSIIGLSHHYAEAGGLLALEGSWGCLEIALRNGSAQKLLGVQRGHKVTVKGP